MSRRSRSVGALSFVVAASLLTSIAVTSPAMADDPDYPSWSEVEKAKTNEKAKKKQITKIETLIEGLEDTNAALAKAALELTETYNVAQDELDTATATADTLQDQADAAASAAAESGRRAGALISQIARSGSQDLTLTLVMDGQNADDLLYSLSMVGKVTESSQAIYEQAQLDKNASTSLSDQAAVAQTERETIAEKAKTALANAQSASDAAAQSLADQQSKSDQLYDQLASLKDTTADVEKQYQEGLAWEAAQEAVKEIPVAPQVTVPDTSTDTTESDDTTDTTDTTAPTGTTTTPATSSGGKPNVSGTTTTAAPSANAVAGAIAFAKEQLGEAYVLGGAGPNVWDCSGLTKQSYAAVGVYIGTHSSTNQYSTMSAAGKLVTLDNLVAGDLLFYSNGGSTSGSKYHTAMYIGAGQMIEAPYPGAVVRIKPIRYGDLVPYAGRPTP
jgi:cell wall-associated NlpC family hydrolase